MDKISIEDFCRDYKIKNYTINADLTVDVSGSVNLFAKFLSIIPINFNKVDGNFDIRYNILTSLNGCPKYVGGDFMCSDNYITSLEFSPKIVDGNFLCQGNALLTTLDGIGEVKRDILANSDLLIIYNRNKVINYILS